MLFFLTSNWQFNFVQLSKAYRPREYYQANWSGAYATTSSATTNPNPTYVADVNATYYQNQNYYYQIANE